MKTISIIALCCVWAGAAFGEPTITNTLLTKSGAVLCTQAAFLDEAATIRDKEKLRGLGCMRSPYPVLATLEQAEHDSWAVRYRPEGIPDGIVLWAKPEAFTAHLRQAAEN